jgi:hypothetical protein
VTVGLYCGAGQGGFGGLPSVGSEVDCRRHRGRAADNTSVLQFARGGQGIPSNCGSGLGGRCTFRLLRGGGRLNGSGWNEGGWRYVICC